MKVLLARQQGKWPLAVSQKAGVVLIWSWEGQVGLVPAMAEPAFGPTQNPCHVSGVGGLLPTAFLPSLDHIVLADLPN